MKARKPKEYEIRHVQSYGEIGAGTVVPFAPRDGLVPIIVPVGSPADEFLGTMTVRGRSLENEFIFDGDILLLTRKFSKKDITPDTICVVFIRSTGELLAKKILHSDNGSMVTLRSSGGGVKDTYYQPDDIEVRGIVFGFQRMRNEFGRFSNGKENEIPY